jgi:O-acetylserine/cysteine efflux transporter
LSLRDFALLLVVCLGWSAHTVIGKIVVSDMGVPPLFYAAIRFAIVAVVALPWLLPSPRPRWRVVLVSFLMGGGGFALFFLGIRTASPSSAAIVLQLGIPITTLFSLAMLGEKLDRRRGLGVVLTFLGVVLVIWDPIGFQISFGLLFILGTTVAGSFAAVMMKQIAGVRPMQLQAWAGVSSVLPLTLLTWSFEDDQLALALAAGWPFVAAVLFSALFVSLVTHTIYYGLIMKYPANLIAPLTVMNPLLTVTLGILVTGDHFGPRMAVGTALALLGVLALTIGRDQMQPLILLLRGRFR